ncbi:hypothetical protein GCK72_007579 [Caenorhabditis remanei]|uniref:Uncharacterized protein n=1 Tax=Caenorhabditis remanei TaxID=31234 RepID=A0A6A5HHN3_CAERE|nr:hypothetical protein GCK72_007579 [Caenorhabditis remanei]KAF1767620.1 hypothetical protein GCK72_007579 [Caenorhabditis remanei]
MHELIWSKDLLTILDRLDWSVSWPEARITWRYTSLESPLYSLRDIEKYATDFWKKTPKEINKEIQDGSTRSMKKMELFNPLQRFIGCTPKTEKGAVFIVCLVGTKNDSGICVAIKPEEESYFGRQSDFMSDINEIRRHYAKEYRVPNMHALTWNDKLAEVLEPLGMDDVRAQAKKTWRYGALNTYDNTIYHIKADVTQFFEMNRTAKNDHIVKTLSDKDTMDRLEFLNPLQKTIACGRKEDERVTLIICLMGPEGNFTIFDTSFQSQSAAGSKCDKGYYNEDGLCIVQIPTQEPIIDYRKMAEEERNKASTEEPEPEPLLENGNTQSLRFLFSFLIVKWFHSVLN